MGVLDAPYDSALYIQESQAQLHVGPRVIYLRCGFRKIKTLIRCTILLMVEDIDENSGKLEVYQMQTYGKLLRVFWTKHKTNEVLQLSNKKATTLNYIKKQ